MDASEIIAGLIILAVIYMIPTIVAFWRGHPNRWVILLLNIF
ncbi:superinfection immunity protein [Aminobacter sp. P9b]